MLKESIRLIGHQQYTLDPCLFVHKVAGNYKILVYVHIIYQLYYNIIVLSAEDKYIDEVVTAFKALCMQLKTWVTPSTIWGLLLRGERSD